MKNIILLCAAGMSTSMLVKKIKEAATEENYECEISAHAIAEAENFNDIADIILLGPQVRFQLQTVKEACPDVLVDVIDPVAYGQMNGAKVLEQVKTALEE